MQAARDTPTRGAPSGDGETGKEVVDVPTLGNARRWPSWSMCTRLWPCLQQKDGIGKGGDGKSHYPMKASRYMAYHLDVWYGSWPPVKHSHIMTPKLQASHFSEKAPVSSTSSAIHSVRALASW